MMKKLFYSMSMAVAVLFSASASAVSSSPVVVYQTTDIVNQYKFKTDSFSITNAGQYKATLSDFAFYDGFEKMGLAVTTSTQLFGKIVGPGSFTFNATPGMYYATFAGIAGDPSKVSTYGIQIAMVPEIETWIMMILGLGMVGYMVTRRKREEESNDFNACAA